MPLATGVRILNLYQVDYLVRIMKQATIVIASKKIYGGLNWIPDLRSPLTEPGVDVQAGDYILTVNGADVTADKNFYSYFENTAEKIVTLTVASSADGRINA